MEQGKIFWESEARSYVADCRTRSSSVRASEFASRMRRSPAQLAREFHASAGCCVKDYLLTLQIEWAKELLRTTGCSTARIAGETGFGTVRSFYRAFRRCTGVSPTEYRKEMSLATAEGRN